jgi:hypothetical protein
MHFLKLAAVIIAAAISPLSVTRPRQNNFRRKAAASSEMPTILFVA